MADRRVSGDPGLRGDSSRAGTATAAAQTGLGSTVAAVAALVAAATAATAAAASIGRNTVGATPPFAGSVLTPDNPPSPDPVPPPPCWPRSPCQIMKAPAVVGPFVPALPPGHAEHRRVELVRDQAGAAATATTGHDDRLRGLTTVLDLHGGRAATGPGRAETAHAANASLAAQATQATGTDDRVSVLEVGSGSDAPDEHEDLIARRDWRDHLVHQRTRAARHAGVGLAGATTPRRSRSPSPPRRHRPGR